MATNQFLIRAREVGINTNNPAATLHVDGTARVEGNTRVGGLFGLSRSTITVTDMTLVPTTSYVVLECTGKVTLNSTTAIANGSSVGTILILQGAPNLVQSEDSVTIPYNANTRLISEGYDHALSGNETMMLIWDGFNWVQLSETELN